MHVAIHAACMLAWPTMLSVRCLCRDVQTACVLCIKVASGFASRPDVRSEGVHDFSATPPDGTHVLNVDSSFIPDELFGIEMPWASEHDTEGVEQDEVRIRTRPQRSRCRVCHGGKGPRCMGARGPVSLGCDPRSLARIPRNSEFRAVCSERWSLSPRVLGGALPTSEPYFMLLCIKRRMRIRPRHTRVRVGGRAMRLQGVQAQRRV